MSTYTRYVVNVKENLQRICNPGNVDDGICEQSVIFSNPNNMYNGTFIGDLSALGTTFSDVTIDGDSIISDGTVINGTAFVTDDSGEHVAVSDAMHQLYDAVSSIQSICSDISGMSDSISALSAYDMSILLSVESMITSTGGEMSGLTAALEYLSGCISNEVSTRISTDTALSTSINSISSDIGELWKNVKGGLNFMGVVSADESSQSKTLVQFLQDNFQTIYDVSPSEALEIPVRKGFFYPVSVDPVSAKCTIGGITLTHGDWLIAKESFITKDAMPSCLAVFDAQDQDAARLDADNAFTGQNTFAGASTFSSIAADTISCKLDSYKWENGSLQTLCADAWRSMTGLSGECKSLDSKISANGIQLQDLSGDVLSLASRCMHYRGDLAGSDTTLYDMMQHTYGSVTHLSAGEMLRAPQSFEVTDSHGDVLKLHANDYIILKTDIPDIRDIAVSDFDIIRDAEAEVMQLSSQMAIDDAFLSGSISTLSDYASDSIGSLSSAVDSVSEASLDNDTALCGAVSSLSSQEMQDVEMLSGSISSLSDSIGHLSSDVSSLSTAAFNNDTAICNAVSQLCTSVNDADQALSDAIDAIVIPSDLSSFSNSPGYAKNDEVAISYSSSSKRIVLSAGSHVTSVDCTDFIKDGMLSTAELCGTTLVLNFNTDSGSDPISVELSNFVDDYDSKITELCTGKADVSCLSNYLPLSGGSISGMLSIEDGLEVYSYYTGQFLTAWDRFSIANGNERQYLGDVLQELSNRIDLKQDALTSVQVSAIDSVVAERRTYITLTDGTVEEYVIIGTLDSQWMMDNGFSDRTGWLKSIASIDIGTSVTSIGSYVFDSCSTLTDITMPNSVTSIGMGAFYVCGGLTSITIPDSVTIIEPMAFYVCYGLKTATIGTGVVSIGTGAFSGCSGFMSVIFRGKTLEEVQSMANYSNWGIDPSVIMTWNDASQEWTLEQLSAVSSEISSKASIASLVKYLPLSGGTLSGEGHDPTVVIDDMADASLTWRGRGGRGTLGQDADTAYVYVGNKSNAATLIYPEYVDNRTSDGQERGRYTWPTKSGQLALENDLSSKADVSSLANYLPLSGGQTTGSIGIYSYDAPQMTLSGEYFNMDIGLYDNEFAFQGNSNGEGVGVLGYSFTKRDESIVASYNSSEVENIQSPVKMTALSASEWETMSADANSQTLYLIVED